MDITISFKNATCFAKDRWYIKGRVIHVTVSNDFFYVGRSPRFILSVKLHKRFPLTPTVRGG